MEFKKISKENILNVANTIGNATKNAVNNISETTKNVTTTVVENVTESSEQFSKHINQLRFENDIKRLCPVFKSDLLEESFILPSMIKIVEYDKRMENKACEDAIGFFTGKDVKILNIYREYIDLLNVTFYPYIEQMVYYVDPCYNDFYIKIDEYFAYLKKMRVDELTSVAQNLGAKHMEIVLKSDSKKSGQHNYKGGVNAIKISGEGSSARSHKEYTGIEVAAKIDFVGNDKPTAPKLIYFKDESDIKALIKMRLDPGENKILSKTYSLQYGNSSGIKVSDALKIDTALSQVNCNVNISSEAFSESTTILEYTIVF